MVCYVNTKALRERTLWAAEHHSGQCVSRGRQHAAEPSRVSQRYRVLPVCSSGRCGLRPQQLALVRRAQRLESTEG